VSVLRSAEAARDEFVHPSEILLALAQTSVSVHRRCQQRYLGSEQREAPRTVMEAELQAHREYDGGQDEVGAPPGNDPDA
jgi:hypothetical protein